MHSEISAQLLYELSIKNIIQNNNMILTFIYSIKINFPLKNAFKI